jgi:hypothetical protein
VFLAVSAKEQKPLSLYREGVTLQQIIADLVRQITMTNGVPACVFQDLYKVLHRKLRDTDMIPVDFRKLAAIINDLGKLQRRANGLGILESDLPPSWWQENAITSP